MKMALCILRLTALFGLCASAEDFPPTGDVFIGYSFLRVNSAQQVPAFTANGGIGTMAWNINNHLGIEVEFGGYHNGNVNNLQFDTTTYSYLFGPRVAYGRVKRFDPYVHGLFGIIHGTTSIAASSILIPTTQTVPVPSSGRYASSQTTFGMAIGGGIDIKVRNRILFRPAQIDYVLSRFETPTFLGQGQVGPSSTRTQNHFRYAVGFAFTFDTPSF